MKIKFVKKLNLLFILLTLYSLPAICDVHEISQKDKKFSVATMEIKVGDTIKFKNDEKDVTHNVYSLGPKNSFELKTQAPQTSSEVTFKEAGETQVECAIHTDMQLKVVVKAQEKAK